MFTKRHEGGNAMNDLYKLTTGDGRIMLIIMVDDAHDFDGLVIEDKDGNVFTIGEDARIIGKRAMRHLSSCDL